MPDYRCRMNTVLEYIDNNLGSGLEVSQLSELACLSRFHFHRIFVALLGLSAGQYIRLMRFKKVSYQLVFRPRLSITDIAFAAGFESSASLSREFKRQLGISPSQFRKQPDWQKWRTVFDEQYAPVNCYLNNQNQAGSNDINKQNVNIVQFAETRVAVKEHYGPQHSIAQSVATFIKWRVSHGLNPRTNATYNILYDEPQQHTSGAFRVDIAVQTDSDPGENAEGIVLKSIPAGRCAVLRHLGADALLAKSMEYLYASWLPLSGEQLRDYPCFWHRISWYPDVPEHQTVVDIYLPLQ